MVTMMKIMKKNKTINEKAKGTKKYVIKRELMFDHSKESLFDDKIILKSQQRFRSDHHKVYTEKVNKIALSSNDGKRIQTNDNITTYPYGMLKPMLLPEKITSNIYI